MKNIFSIIISLLLLFEITSVQKMYAQTPSWQWVKGGGGSAGNVQNSGESARMMGIDRNSNIYIAFDNAEEYFTIDTFYRANPTLASFVCSYTCDGTLRWVKEIGGNGYASIGGMCVDSNGNVYLSGESGSNYLPLAGATIIDTIVNLPYDPALTEYMLKLDSNGHRVWLKFPGNPLPFTAMSFTVMYSKAMIMNEQGELVVLTTPNLNFDPTILWQGFQATHKAPHVAKFDTATGNFISIIQLDFIGNLRSDPLRFAEYNNDYYIAYSSQEDSLIIGGNLIVSTTLPPNPTYKIIISRFGVNGNYKWHQETGGNPWNSYEVYEFSNMIFKDGKMYTAGNAHSGVTVYGNLIHNVIDTTKWNNYIVCKDTADLNTALWVSQMSPKNDWTNVRGRYIGKNKESILIGAYNGLIVLNNGDTLKAPNTVSNNGGICIISISATTGLANWGVGTKHGAGSTFRFIESIVSDQHDNIFVGGIYNDSLYNSFGQGIYYNGGAKRDFFISKIAYSDICNCNTGSLYPSLINVSGNTVSVNGFVAGTVDSLKWIWGDGNTSIYPIQNATVNHSYSANGIFTVCLRSYNACGIKDSCFQVNSSGVSIQEYLNDAILIYPNPTSGLIRIDYPYSTSMSVLVYNLVGELLTQKDYTVSPVEMDISQFSAGVYFLEITLPDGSKGIRKIVKE